MKTSIRLLGATLGATAIVGTSAFAANACDLGGPDGAQGTSIQGTSSSVGSFAAPFASHFLGQHFDLGFGQDGSFEQEQAAIVDRLTNADARLTDLISQVSDAGSTAPTSGATQELSQLQNRQATLESLIDAVKAATDVDQLKAAFEDAFTNATGTPDQSDADAGTTPSDLLTAPTA